MRFSVRSFPSRFRFISALFLFLACLPAWAQMDFDLLAQLGAYTTPEPPPVTLPGLAGYWRMDSTNQAGSDAVGTNTYTPYGGVTTTAALLTNGILCLVAANGQGVTIADGPTTSLENRSWAWSMWVNFYNNAATYFAGQYAASLDWALIRSSSIINFRYSTNANNYIALSAGVTSASNVWHLITCMVDAPNRQAILILNTNTFVTNDIAAVQASARNIPIEIGRMTGNPNELIGVVDDCLLVTNRVLTVSEISNLYNGGAGINLVRKSAPSKFNPMWAGGYRPYPQMPNEPPPFPLYATTP